MDDLWENRSYAICERLLGEDKYKKRLTKLAQVRYILAIDVEILFPDGSNL